MAEEIMPERDHQSWCSRFFVPAGITQQEKDMSNCASEYPGPNDIARVESPITHQNAHEAFDQMMFIKVIALLLANQDQNSARELDLDRQSDLGRLLFFLADQPSTVLGEFAAEKRPEISNIVSDLPLNEGGAS